jgi:hypothetical protein
MPSASSDARHFEKFPGSQESSSVGDAFERAKRTHRDVRDSDVLPQQLLIDPKEAVRVTTRVEHVLFRDYGLRVIRTALPNKQTGVLNGVSIMVENRLPPATQLFILLHLAGHTFQMTGVDQSSTQQYFSRKDLEYNDRVRERERYEQEATSYALNVLQRAKAPMHIQRWFRGVSALDFQYGKRYVEDKESGVTLKNSEPHVRDWWPNLPVKQVPAQNRREIEPYEAS